MSEPVHIAHILRDVFAGMSTDHIQDGVLLSEYVVVSVDEWHDFRSVMRSRGFEFTYSIEDAEDGGVEYHIHSHLEAAEDILWAIEVVDGLSSVSEDVGGQQHVNDKSWKVELKTATGRGKQPQAQQQSCYSVRRGIAAAMFEIIHDAGWSCQPLASVSMVMWRPTACYWKVKLTTTTFMCGSRRLSRPHCEIW